MATVETIQKHAIATPEIKWPQKQDVIGVDVSPTTYEEAVDIVLRAAEIRRPAIVSCHAVHAVVTSSCDPSLREKMNSFEMITPDGQPVRWALNLLHRCGLNERVYGPELMMRICRRAAEAGVSVYLYGGASQQTVESLGENLTEACPGLVVAGSESPPFRPLTEQEDAAAVKRINASGAGLVFIGLGFPKQDLFAYDHRNRIRAVQVCVGAAFDFHAGIKPMAPCWMQRYGLEWLFRLIHEPRRLMRRYLITNTVFVAKTAWAFCRRRRDPRL